MMLRLLSIQNSIEKIDNSIDRLLNVINEQSEEIEILKNQNVSLKENYLQAMNEIANYVAELEQIKTILLKNTKHPDK